MVNNITISSTDGDSNGVPDDVDALARVAYGEANNVFSYYKGQGLSDADGIFLRSGQRTRTGDLQAAI